MTNKIITLHDAYDGHEVDVFVDHIFHMEDREIDNPAYNPEAVAQAARSARAKKKKPVEISLKKTVTVLYSHEIVNTGNTIYISESRDEIKKLIRSAK